ncbi:MAG: gamma-glutamyltransferase [Solirubrobacteraceae bacterium]
MSVSIARPLLRGPRAALAAAHPLAVAAGADVFAAGGNAVDAAVAAAAALAVLCPDACGLGGDALMLVSAEGEPPLAYLGAAAVPAEPLRPVTLYGPASAGVPGAVAAWCEAHARFGRLALAEVLAPSVTLAERGFPASDWLSGALARRRERLTVGAEGWSVLGAAGARTLRQPELAATLRAISAGGAAAFYTGAVAEATAAAVAGRARALAARAGAGEGGGTPPEGRGITPADLAAYSVSAEPTLSGDYGRARLAVAPSPSQALLVVLALAAIEGAPGPGGADGEHAAIEAIKEVFELRDALTGGGDVQALRDTPIPAAGARANLLRGPTAADHTAAVASADAAGLVVSMLVSVFHEFGSGVLVPEAGFLLNNRLSGLANSGSWPAPGGRPGHTLSPMLLELDGRRLALATPGADGQVQTLVQITRLLADAGAGLSEALAVPRWRAVAGRLEVEDSCDAGVIRALAARGHVTDRQPDGHPLFGGVAAAGIERDGGTVCAADPRGEVWAAVR